VRYAIIAIVAWALGFLTARFTGPATSDQAGPRADPVQSRISAKLDAIEAALRSVIDSTRGGAQGGTRPDGRAEPLATSLVVQGDPTTVHSVLEAISAHELAAERQWWEATLSETRRHLELKPSEARSSFEHKQVDEIGQALSDLATVDGSGDFAGWKARYKFLFSNLVVAGSSVWTDWATTWGRPTRETGE